MTDDDPPYICELCLSSRKGHDDESEAVGTVDCGNKHMFHLSCLTTKWCGSNNINTQQPDGGACPCPTCRKSISALTFSLLRPRVSGSSSSSRMREAIQRGDLDRVLAVAGTPAAMLDASIDGEHAMLYAALKGHAFIVRAFLELGVKVGVATTRPTTHPAAAQASALTALHIAALKGHPYVAAVLLAAGADVNAVDSNGNTALHLVVTNNGYSHGPLLVLKALLSKGADTRLVNRAGSTALSRAKLLKSQWAVGALLDDAMSKAGGGGGGGGWGLVAGGSRRSRSRSLLYNTIQRVCLFVC
jgi:hypothetical protein